MHISVDTALPWHAAAASAQRPFSAHAAVSMISSALLSIHLSGPENLFTLCCSPHYFSVKTLQALPLLFVPSAPCFQHAL